MSRFIALASSLCLAAVAPTLRSAAEGGGFDPLELEIELEPEANSDILLVEPRIQILESGRRIFSFASDFTGPGTRAVVFVADPRQGRYRTVVVSLAIDMIDMEEGDRGDPPGSEEELERILGRLAGVDWARLPTSQVRAAGELPDNRRRSPFRLLNGLVWAESQIAPDDWTPSRQPGNCRGSQRISVLTLDSGLQPLAGTEAALTWRHSKGIEEVFDGGSFCWAAGEAGSARRWVVHQCLPSPPRLLSPSLGREAIFLADSGRDSQATGIIHSARIEGPSCLGGVERALVSQSDWESPDQLFLGAIVEWKADWAGPRRSGR